MGRGMEDQATFRHTTVLLNEAVDGVLARPDGVYVDGTFGRGGHSRLILSRLSSRGHLIAFDPFNKNAFPGITSNYGRAIVTTGNHELFKAEVQSTFKLFRLSMAIKAISLENPPGLLLKINIFRPSKSKSENEGVKIHGPLPD